MRLTSDSYDDLLGRGRANLGESIERVRGERSRSKDVVQHSYCGDLLTRGISYNGRQSQGSETRVLLSVQCRKMQELEKVEEIRLSLGL